MIIMLNLYALIFALFIYKKIETEDSYEKNKKTADKYLSSSL
jgi:hypothetical protein